MPKKVYPSCIRINNYSSNYCEIAMEAFYNASTVREEILKKEFEHDAYYELSVLHKEVVKTTVFSAMTLEAFFNDYAAAVLGDSEFYDSFDRLSPISKFELIARFILKADIDKGKAYYSRLKELFHKRNEYVHNKSEACSCGYASLEEAIEAYRLYEESTPEIEPPRIDRKKLDAEIKEALNALKAIRDIAQFFDAHDANAFAVSRLFGMYFQFYEDASQKYKLFALSALQIKVEKDENPV